MKCPNCNSINLDQNDKYVECLSCRLRAPLYIFNEAFKELSALPEQVEKLKAEHEEIIKAYANTLYEYRQKVEDIGEQNRKLVEALSRACIALRVKGENKLADEIFLSSISSAKQPK